MLSNVLDVGLDLLTCPTLVVKFERLQDALPNAILQNLQVAFVEGVL